MDPPKKNPPKMPPHCDRCGLTTVDLKHDGTLWLCGRHGTMTAKKNIADRLPWDGEEY